MENKNRSLIKQVIILLIGIGMGKVLSIETISSLLTGLFFVFLFAKLVHFIRNRKHKGYEKKGFGTQPITEEKIEFYKQQGMTKEEVITFRSTLQESKESIEAIERNMENSAVLTIIEEKTHLIRLMKDYFKELTTAPKRMVEADQFLYRYLPSLKKLTEKYIEMDCHVSKSEATSLTLEKTEIGIAQLARLIEEDYQKFQTDDLEAVAVELEFLNRQHEEVTEKIK